MPQGGAEVTQSVIMLFLCMPLLKTVCQTVSHLVNMTFMSHSSHFALYFEDYFIAVSLKSDPNYYTVLFGSDDIPLWIISDWPFSKPMESLIPKFRPVAHGAKRKMMFVIMDVTLCKHSETLAPFSCLYHLEMIRNSKNWKLTSSWKYCGSQVSKICLLFMHFMWYKISQCVYFSNI